MDSFAASEIAAPLVSKRKREGVVYTPDLAARFLVERTIALALDERRAALAAAHGLDEEAAPTPPEREIAFWQAYLAALREFTIVDPACGTGALLVVAFDEMARRYRDAASRLQALGVDIGFDICDEIVAKNLHGVDLDPRSVEAARLSLWLKTERRERARRDLEATIRAGDGLVEDAAHTERPFDWRAGFPDVFARGGFDIVIGNPPYVRMEYLKAVKPYLEEHYVVAADRADLYAYFFERSVRLMKEGGRLGFISSSSFFRTGSGENLRAFLAAHATIECVVDFGDLQLFDGVTTYPAILTLKKGEEKRGDLFFLLVKDSLPEDLGRAFAKGAQPMRRARLGAGAWRFEDEAMARLRDKIAAGRKTLRAIYGPPLWGIKTGLNDAFIIDARTRDRLVAAAPDSAELLKPYLRGKNIDRWRVEPEGLWLIDMPKGKIDIERYPAIKDRLTQFGPRLEQRATRQAWFELQQAQLAYRQCFGGPKIVFPDISQGPKFAFDDGAYLIDATAFALPAADHALLAILNSKLCWSFLHSVSNPLRGGRWRLRVKAQYLELLPMPELSPRTRERLAAAARSNRDAASRRWDVISAMRGRILDLATPGRRKLTRKLGNWHELDSRVFRDEIRKTFRIDLPFETCGEWDADLAESAAEVSRLTEAIGAAEREIDAMVYELFGLSAEEIAHLEAALDGQY